MKKNFLLLLMLLCGCFANAQTSFKEYEDKFEALHDAGKYDDALAVVNEWIQQYPGIHDYSNRTELDPYREKAQLLAHDLKQHDAAISFLLQAITTMHAEDWQGDALHIAELYTYLAWEEQDAGKKDSALYYLNKKIEADPTEYYAYKKRAEQFESMHLYDLAILDYQAAVKVQQLYNPDLVPNLWTKEIEDLKPLMAQMDKRSDTALRYSFRYNKTLGLKHLDSAVALANAHAADIQVLNQLYLSLKYMPGNISARFMRGCILANQVYHYFVKNQLDSINNHYKSVAARDLKICIDSGMAKYNADVYLEYFFTLSITDKEEQMSAIDHFLQLKPNDAYGNFLKARVMYFSSYSLEEVTPYAQRAVDLDPDNKYFQEFLQQLKDYASPPQEYTATYTDWSSNSIYCTLCGGSGYYTSGWGLAGTATYTEYNKEYVDDNGKLVYGNITHYNEPVYGYKTGICPACGGSGFQ